MSTDDKKDEAVAKIAAAAVKTAADVAADNRRSDAAEAREDRKEELRVAAMDRSYEFWKSIALAFFVMVPPTVVGGIGAWYGVRSETKLREVQQLGEETHELVNSGSLVQLKLNAELSHWKAKQTGDPEDIRAAETADKLVAEHIEKQKRADATKGRRQ